MAIKGSLKEASLPDVLQLLAMGQKTGCLSVADRSNFGYVFFDHGQITYASIVNRRDRLGDILVKNGLITADQLQAAIERQAHVRNKRLGELLVEMGALNRPDLERYMRVQIEEAVYYLFTWSSGTFSFESEVKPEEQDFLVRIGPESLLLEGARRVDEWSLIEKKIPSFDLIFVVERQRIDEAHVHLAPEQERILPLLDGKRDVSRVIEDSGLLEFEVGKALYGLVTAGFAHRLGKTSVPEAVPAAVGARIDEHRNLGLAFYKTGMFDEAAREFRRVTDLAPSDEQAHFFIGLVALRQGRWADALDALRGAAETGGGKPAILHNLAVALEQLGRLAEAEAAFSAAAANSEAPAILIGWAIVALKRGEGEVAVTRLDKARAGVGSKGPGALWYWARSLAAVTAGREAEGLQFAEEGVAAHPRSGPLRNNLAVLAERAGQAERAEQLLTAALEDDPTLPQLSKNLGDLCYRAGRAEEAREAYLRAVKLAPKLGDDVFFKLGNLAFKFMQPQDAVGYWKEAVALNPAHETAKRNLATVGSAGGQGA
jgi:tetratricopeptide (TPR) repeat protein